MKKRNVMRLLAVVMAVSLAATSVPGTALTGLETVYAANSAEPTINDGGLSNGHLYQEVSREEHTHTAACYENTAVQATTSTNYFTSVADSTEYGKVSGTEGTDKVSITNGSTTYYKKVTSGYWTLTEEGSCPTYTVPEGKYIAEDSEGSTYSLYDGADEDTTHAIEVARNNTNKKAGERIAYLKSTDLTTIKGAYASTPDASGTTNLSVEGTSTLTSDYYTVTKYAKATGSNASSIPGAIVMTQAYVDDNTNYPDDAGFDGAAAGEVYIPLVVSQATITPASAGTTQKVGSVTYTAVSDGSSGIVWINKAVKSSTQPEKCYAIDSTHKKFILQTATAATHKDTVAEYTYSYDKASVVSGEVRFASTTIGSDETIYSVTNDTTTTYYKDVSAEFVTGIVVKKAATEQYVTNDSKETDLDDTVTLTFGVGTTSTDDVDAGDVISNFTASTNYTGSGSDVTIGSITTTDAVYYNAEIKAGEANIVTKNDIKALSSLRDFSAEKLAALGLTGSGSYQVKTVTAPTMTVSTTANITNSTPLTGYTGKTVYFYDGSENPYPTVGKTDETITGTTTDWIFKWVDEIVDASGTVKTTSYSNSGTAQAAAELSDLTLDAVGHHKVYLAAYYKTATTPTAKTEALDFYVIKDNPTTISYSDPVTYTGAQLAEPTLNTPPETNVTPTYSYYLTTGGSENAATTGLPTDAGAYTIVANFPEDLNLGLKKTKATTSVTISKATIKIDAGETDVEAYTADNAGTVYEVSLKDYIKDYEKNTSDTKEKSGSEFSTSAVSYVEDITYVTASKKLTFKVKSTATSGGSSDTISGTIETTNYELTVTYKVNVATAGTEVLNITAKDLTTYFKDYDTNTGKTAIEGQIQNKQSDGTYSIVGYVKQDSTGSTTTDFPSAVGTYTVKISYTRAANTGVEPNVKAATGKGTAILTIKKKPLTITAQSQTFSVGKEFG
jgi:hypothetical protein